MVISYNNPFKRDGDADGHPMVEYPEIKHLKYRAALRDIIALGKYTGPEFKDDTTLLSQAISIAKAALNE